MSDFAPLSAEPLAAFPLGQDLEVVLPPAQYSRHSVAPFVSISSDIVLPVSVFVRTSVAVQVALSNNSKVELPVSVFTRNSAPITVTIDGYVGEDPRVSSDFYTDKDPVTDLGEL